MHTKQMQIKHLNGGALQITNFFFFKVEVSSKIREREILETGVNNATAEPTNQVRARTRPIRFITLIIYMP